MGVRRGLRRDGGASTVEYGAIILLVVSILIAVTVVAIPESVKTGTIASICKVFKPAAECDKIPAAAAGDPETDPDADPQADDPNAPPVTNPDGTDPNTEGLDPNDPDVIDYNNAKNRATTADNNVKSFDQQVKDVTQEVLDLLADLVGITDIKKCLTEGDIVACISSLVNFVPWGKLFKLLKKIPAAVKIAKRLKKLWDDFKAAKKEKQLADEAAEKAAQKLKDKPKKKDDPKTEAACPIKRPSSFVPGTLVLLADGTREPIEDVRVGDQVWATDPDTGRSGPHPVTALINSDGVKHLVTIGTGPLGLFGTVTATDAHPFWNADRHLWIPAGDLSVADRLTTWNGNTVPVTTVHQVLRTQQVHNLTVADAHTYYVVAGGTPLLVHNSGPRDCGFRPEVDDALTKLENLKKDPLGDINKLPKHNHYSAARREAKGEVVARKADGTPFSHIRDLQEARDGVKKVVKALQKEYDNPPDTMTDRGIDVLESKLKEAKKLLKETDDFLAGIGFPKATPPYHTWPPGS